MGWKKKREERQRNNSWCIGGFYPWETATENGTHAIYILSWNRKVINQNTNLMPSVGKSPENRTASRFVQRFVSLCILPLWAGWQALYNKIICLFVLKITKKTPSISTKVKPVLTSQVLMSLVWLKRSVLVPTYYRLPHSSQVTSFMISRVLL